MRYSLEVLDEIDSTNSYLKRRIAGGEIADFPHAVVAHTQTSGRGRLTNRSFSSERGGLYFSVAYRACHFACLTELITIGAGVAVARAVESLTGEDVSLKWVNDVLIGGKKVCGILCESICSGDISDAVYIVGIGINVNDSLPRGFLEEKAGSVKTKATLDELLGKILDELTAVYGDGEGKFVSEYNARLSLRGKRVSVLRGGVSVDATVSGATAAGLECVTDGGETFTVRTCDEIVSDMYGICRQG